VGKTKFHYFFLFWTIFLATPGKVPQLAYPGKIFPTPILRQKV